VCLILLRPYKSPFVREFLPVSLLATLAPIALFPDIKVALALFPFWLVILFPATFAGALICEEIQPGPLKRIAFYLTLPALALVVLLFMGVRHREPYEEPLHLTADALTDRQPAFIDVPEFWYGVPYAQPAPDQAPRLEMNKSAAVVSLDIPAVESYEAHVQKKRFASYREAVTYLQGDGLPWVPSVQMVDHRVKVFSDDAYAAIDRHTQREAEALGGGRQVFLEGLLAALLKNDGT
jgi:hypothetical protein